MEFAERRRLVDAHDLLVCGSITDEWRTGRYQHGSKAVIYKQRLGRTIGNSVFPNGFISTNLVPPPDSASFTLSIEGAMDIARNFILTVNGQKMTAELNEQGIFALQLKQIQNVELKLEKAGDKYPVVHAIYLK